MMQRHRLDPFSLVAGVAAAVVGLAFLVGSPDVAHLHLDWIWPVPFVLAGILILATAARRDRTGADGTPDRPTA